MGLFDLFFPSPRLPDPPPLWTSTPLRVEKATQTRMGHEHHGRSVDMYNVSNSRRDMEQGEARTTTVFTQVWQCPTCGVTVTLSQIDRIVTSPT